MRKENFNVSFLELHKTLIYNWTKQFTTAVFV